MSSNLDHLLQEAFDHLNAGRLDAAASLATLILSQRPGDPAALLLQGILHLRAGHLPQAIDAFQAALNRAPDDAETHHQLALALQAAGNLPQARAHFLHAIRLAPHAAAPHLNLGNLHFAQGDFAGAVHSYQQALRLAPHDAGAFNNLGQALESLQRLDDAIAAYRRAIDLAPTLVAAHNNLANALLAKLLVDPALHHARIALQLDPAALAPAVTLANALQAAGEHREAVALYRDTLRRFPHDSLLHSNLIFALLFDPDTTAADLRAQLADFDARHAAPLPRFSHAPTDTASRPLRVGFVSPDFRDHVIGRNLLPLFRHLDRSRFELFSYSDVLAPDALTHVFRSLSTRFHSIIALSDADAASLIHHDSPDLLIDLTLHLSRNRLLLFARKPAPIQITFAGYPGSTGLRAIDFRITDPHLDPPPIPPDAYTERSLVIPSFWCFEPDNTEPPVQDPPALANGHITFGCLNNFSKTNPDTFRLWASVLLNVPNSRLLLLAPEGACRDRVLRFFATLGIDGHRLSFVSKAPRPAYFATYHRIDIALDTLPYNGHSTSLDGLFMGVPLVSLVGNTVVGRAGLSILSNLGLHHLVAHTPAAFVAAATSLASDLPALTALRHSLRERLRASPLMDAPGFAAAIGNALLTACGRT